MTSSLVSLALRSSFTFFIGAFALLIISIIFDIIDPQQISSFLNLSPDATKAFEVVTFRVQEVVSNLLESFTGIAQDVTDKAGIDIDVKDIREDARDQIEGGIKNSLKSVDPS